MNLGAVATLTIDFGRGPAQVHFSLSVTGAPNIRKVMAGDMAAGQAKDILAELGTDELARIGAEILRRHET